VDLSVPLKRVLAYQAHDYSSDRWIPDIRLSDKYLTSLLKLIGESRELALSFMGG
jgi:hypothetical protein